MAEFGFGEDDLLGEVAHGAAGAAAVVAQFEVGFLFAHAVALHKDAFGAFDEFARFELAFHFEGLFLEAAVLFGEHGFGDGAAHLFADEGEHGDEVGGELLRMTEVDVDDADDFAAGDEGDRDKGLIGIFDQGREPFEAFVGAGVIAEGDDGLMFGDPTGDAFAHFHFELTEGLGVGELGGSEHDFAAGGVHEVDEAGIAPGDLNGKAQDFAEHFIKR